MGKKVWGIAPRNICHTVLDEELTRLGLETGGPCEARVERMFTWIDNNMDIDTRVDCDCGGYSDTTHFKRCPFCGDAEVEQDDGTVIPGEAILLTPGVEILSAATLDASVQRIKRLKSDMARNYYHLGVMLAEVYDRGLWKLRVKGGNQVYSDFAQWTRAEAGLGRTQALKMIDVATNFSEKEVKDIGHTRLAVALQVPPEYRDRMVEKAHAGASKRDLEKEVAVVKGRPAPRETNGITVAYAAQARTIPFMCAEGDEPAYCIGDQPWAQELLPNDVVQRYEVAEDEEGRLVLHISRRRLDS